MIPALLYPGAMLPASWRSSTGVTPHSAMACSLRPPQRALRLASKKGQGGTSEPTGGSVPVCAPGLPNSPWKEEPEVPGPARPIPERSRRLPLPPPGKAASEVKMQVATPRITIKQNPNLCCTFKDEKHMPALTPAHLPVPQGEHRHGAEPRRRPSQTLLLQRSSVGPTGKQLPSLPFLDVLRRSHSGVDSDHRMPHTRSARQGIRTGDGFSKPGVRSRGPASSEATNRAVTLRVRRDWALLRGSRPALGHGRPLRMQVRGVAGTVLRHHPGSSLTEKTFPVPAPVGPSDPQTPPRTIRNKRRRAPAILRSS